MPGLEKIHAALSIIQEEITSLTDTLKAGTLEQDRALAKLGSFMVVREHLNNLIEQAHKWNAMQDEIENAHVETRLVPLGWCDGVYRGYDPGVPVPAFCPGASATLCDPSRAHDEPGQEANSSTKLPEVDNHDGCI